MMKAQSPVRQGSLPMFKSQPPVSRLDWRFRNSNHHIISDMLAFLRRVRPTPIILAPTSYSDRVAGEARGGCPRKDSTIYDQAGYIYINRPPPLCFSSSLAKATFFPTSHFPNGDSEIFGLSSSALPITFLISDILALGRRVW